MNESWLAEHWPILAIVGPFILVEVVNVVGTHRMRIEINRRLRDSEPQALAQFLRVESAATREDMRMMRQHWEGFINALNPKDIHDLVGRHTRRLDDAEEHLRRHDGKLGEIERRVATLEGEEG